MSIHERTPVHMTKSMEFSEDKSVIIVMKDGEDSWTNIDSKKDLEVKDCDMDSKAETLSKRYVSILGVVSLYWFVSITMVFLNKSLLSGSSSLDAPLFITWYQCIITVLGCYLISGLKRVFPVLLETFPNIETNAKTTVKVLPLSFVFVAMIIFNNLCLKYVGVSFYYIGRSLTTVFNVLTTYLFLGEKTSVKAVICCAVIIVGFWLGVDQEGEVGTFSISGTIYGVLASLFVSLYAIFIKRVLPDVNNNVWLLTYYNNINACIIFIPLMLVFGEFPIVLNYTEIFSQYFWASMTAAGVFGLAIGYVTGLQVKVTSPLTHNISGTAKAAAQTVMATQWNAEVKTGLWWVSNFVVLLGSAAYARVRQLEMAAKSSHKSSVLPTQKGSVHRVKS